MACCSRIDWVAGSCTSPARRGSGGRIRSVVHVGAAVFADAARVERRAAADGSGDVDSGAVCGSRFPGLDGVFRLDVGKGLRDGSTAFSFVYEL